MLFIFFFSLFFICFSFCISVFCLLLLSFVSCFPSFPICLLFCYTSGYFGPCEQTPSPAQWQKVSSFPRSCHVGSVTLKFLTCKYLTFANGRRVSGSSDNIDLHPTRESESLSLGCASRSETFLISCGMVPPCRQGRRRCRKFETQSKMWIYLKI